MIIPFDVPFAFNGPSQSLKEVSKGILRGCIRELGSPNTLRRISNRQVLFELPTTFQVDSPYTENARAVRILLRCLVSLNVAFLQTYPRTPHLYDTDVYYDRTQVWDTIPALYERGYGDCKSLSCALVAERRFAGLRANAVHRFMPGRELLYHILVLGHEGWEDPSKELGMNEHELAYFKQ